MSLIPHNVQNIAVPIHLIKPLIKLLVSEGVSLEALLADTNLPFSCVTKSKYDLPLHALEKLVENAYRLSPSCDFALRLGEQLHFNHDGLLDLRVMTSDTVGQAMYLLNDYHSLLSPFFSLSFRIERNVGLFDATPARDLGHALPFFVECLFAATFSLGKFCTGLRQLPMEIELSYLPPHLKAQHEITAKFESFFQCPVRFGQTRNRAILARALLERSLIFADKPSAEKSDLLCKYLLRSERHPHQLSQQIRHILAQEDLAEVSLESMAKRLCMSPRTLRRQLNSQSLSYKTILESYRKERALKLLNETPLPIDAIAHRLGYQDPSSFSRAFKRWFGYAPASYRALIEHQSDQKMPFAGNAG